MNKTASLRRIQNEVSQINTQSAEYSKMFSLNIVKDNIYKWKGVIYGPEDSLYEGAVFELDIELPENYPYSPLKVKFLTPISHVNVNKNGDICLDILKEKWTSSQNIRSVMLSIILLLSQPNIEDPLNSDLANLYKTNKKQYVDLIKKSCKNTTV